MNSLPKPSTVFFRNPWKCILIKNKRSIFSPVTLGLDSFFPAQAKFLEREKNNKFSNNLTKERNFVNKDTAIFSNDIMRMVYCANQKEDLDLVYTALKKVKSQSLIRLPIYNFYIDVMKLYHIKNCPTEAMKLVKDPLLYPDFESPAAFTIFLDLLFKNQLYQEIIDMYNYRFKHSQFCYRHNIHIIFFAACYKLNTKNSFQEALKIWQSFSNYNYQPGMSIRLLFATHAVNVDQLFCAMEVLPHWTFLEVAENLKCLILAKSQRFEDAFDNIQKILHSEKEVCILQDVIDTIEELVDKSTAENKEVFQSIKHNLTESMKIKKETLESVLFADIDSHSRKSKIQKQSFAQMKG